ncbi:PREDICTED: pre-mRNA-splicing factor cef1-like [Prunus mume]|uniref:Pre-mRNA-splicing factor cef1-like n=1 Tax=Prunus mume TaxID=102107 RepID=A0ABM0NHV3_PRUMU|nr:PREDICTED: pre-mRNA-splicing factor cef1-like [Prunus mume]
MKKISARPWTVGEDRDLIEAVERYGTHRWEAVARFLGTRTGRECQNRWVAWLHPQIRTDEWSQVEDAKLRQLSTLLPAQWQTIADMFNGSRTATSCQLRHSFLLENPQKISNQEGSSTLTKKPGPPRRISSQEGSSSFTQKTGPPQEEDKTPAVKEEEKTPALKEKEKTPALKEEEKTPALKEEEKTPALKEEEKTPALKEEENSQS